MQQLIDRTYDVIVCGAGTSGCVVAARLTDQPGARVLLIEAGSAYTGPQVTDPAQWPANLGSERDWGFEAQPNPGLNGRRMALNMGKGLGGGSSINVMVWARGHRTDWEHFSDESGDPGWGYESVLGYYRRIENWQGRPDPLRRGSTGAVHVAQPHAPQPLALATLEAASQLGIPRFDSPNGEMMEGPGGVAIADLCIKQGKRESVYDAYIAPRLHNPNLHILTHALVARVLFQGRTAIGVEVVVDGQLQRFYVTGEVILSMGAGQGPKSA